MLSHVHIPGDSILGSAVTDVWEIAVPGISKECILPKGVIEIVFNLSGRVEGFLPNSNSITLAPNCFLQGCYTDRMEVKYPGFQHLFGICLHRYMVQPLFKILPSEFKDSIIDLSLLNPYIEGLWDQLMAAPDFQARVSIVKQRFAIPASSFCSRTKYLCDLFSSPGAGSVNSVDELAKDVCYSTRQLNRKSNDLFGISAEELILHKKFRTAIGLMHGDKASLTDIAHNAGFYDQAHFCRVFKDIAGFTAKEYLLRKSQLPFHLFS